jgi:hypothetical protein
MKEQMIGFYKPSDSEFKEMWDTATFVLDTNVLLNLYRYPAKASQELLGALEKLSDRLWLPYHAALEFQRNRPYVIAEQKKRFAEVRKSIQETKDSLFGKFCQLQLKKKHSSINVSAFTNDFEKLTDTFMNTLKELEGTQRNVHNEDLMRGNIDKLFSGKIGPLKFDQEMLANIYKEGDKRNEVEMPPGYMDEKKEQSRKSDSFQYGGLVYKRKYGDLILWKQIIAYAKENKVKKLVLVTDDEKRDWWWIVDSQGEKTIGPRPELVEEIKREGQVEFFYMYNSGQFLKYSKKYLQVEVSDESINQVREIAQIQKEESRVYRRIPLLSIKGKQIEHLVYKWLKNHYRDKAEITQNFEFPDFTILTDDKKIGCEVKYIVDPRNIMHRWRELAFRGYYDVSKNNFDSFFIVFVIENEKNQEISRWTKDLEVPEGVTIFLMEAFSAETGEIMDLHVIEIFEGKSDSYLD